MKYLINYNSLTNVNESSTEETLLSFSKENLAYLLDDDRFKLVIETSEVAEYSIIFSCNRGSSSAGHYGNDYLRGYFTYEEIKDDFIPFLIILEEKYGSKIFKNVNVRTRLSGYWESIAFKDLMNDTIKTTCEKIGYWWNAISIEIDE